MKGGRRDPNGYVIIDGTDSPRGVKRPFINSENGLKLTKVSGG
jgi:hypothetical protein